MNSVRQTFVRGLAKHKPCSTGSMRSASLRPVVVRAVAAELKPEVVMTEEERVFKVRQEVTRRIKVLGEAGRVREAITTLASLASVNIEPDTHAATALVQACCRDMDTAQSVFDELFGDFLQPDEVTFAVLLRGYGAGSTPNWPKVDATLTTMRNKFDIAPTAVSYNCLLELCCRTADLERGQDIIDRMAADGVQPNEFTDEVVARKRVLRSYLRKTFN